MNLWQRFKRLTFWNKVSAIAALCSILCFAGWLLFRSPEDSVRVEVQDSPDAKVQTAVNSPNTTQILIENLTVKLSPQLERKLTMSPVYVNKPQGDKYVTLLRGRLKAPYPVPKLRVEVHGETVEEVDLCPPGSAVYVAGPPGKGEGYVFNTLHNAIGNLELKIVSRQPGKLNIRFSTQE
jgi:hypothetical protein